MKALLWTSSAILIAFLLWPQVSMGVPEPSPASISWQMDISYDRLMPIAVENPRTGQKEIYWFLRYQVINRTGKDRIFVPQIMLYTDKGEIVRAGRGISPTVVQQIKRAINDPVARDMTAMTGKFLQGEDNAKRGIAVFRDFGSDASSVDLFIGGLSGETATVELPTQVTVTEMKATGEIVEKQTDTLVLSKTLRLQYNLSGDRRVRSAMTAVLRNKDWIMR